MATDIAVKLRLLFGRDSENLSRPFFCAVMRLRDLDYALACFWLVIGCLASDNAAQGFLEGRLRILAFKDVELAEETPSKIGGGQLCRISADCPEPVTAKTNRASNSGREWRLSHCAASGRLYSGCAGTPTQARPGETANVHSSCKSDCARGHERRHRHSLVLRVARDLSAGDAFHGP